MIRNLKALGLALVAVFALSAAVASSASAVDKITVAGGGTAILTGSSHDNKFTITKATPLNVECTTTTIAKKTITTGAESVTVTPSYEGRINATPHSTKCDSTVGEVTVDMNGCNYMLTGSTTGGDPTANTDATVWVECEGTNEIKVTTSVGCTLLIPAQTPTSGGVTYTNVAGSNPADIRLEATVTGITYTTTGALCAAGGLSPEGNNADYTGAITITGYNDESGAEGSQVGITTS